jgi:hypothetical protein
MSIFDTATSLAKLAQEAGKIDLYKQAVEMMQQITEQQQQIMKLSEDLRSASELLQMRGQTEFFSNARWLKVQSNNGTQFDGPFCSGCFDANGKMIRLHFVHFVQSMLPSRTPDPEKKSERIYYCPECRRKDSKMQISVVLTEKQRATIAPK